MVDAGTGRDQEYRIGRGGALEVGALESALAKRGRTVVVGEDRSAPARTSMRRSAGDSRGSPTPAG